MQWVLVFSDQHSVPLCGMEAAAKHDEHMSSSVLSAQRASFGDTQM